MTLELRYRAVLVVALVAIVWLIATGAASAGPYGLGAPSLDGQCPASGPCQGWLEPLIHGGYGMSYARTMIPYDAVATADGGGRCVLSGAAGRYANFNPDVPGEQYRTYVYNWLMAAKRLGLQPVIAFTKGSAPAVDNAVPSDSGLDHRRYYCAVYWTLWTAARWGVPIHHLEAWNEPNINGYGGNPAGAAADYTAAYQAAAQVHADYPSVPVAELAAGTLSSMGCGAGAVCSNLSQYLNGYIDALHQTPQYWSFHDYEDVTAAGITESSPYAVNLHGFENVLASRYGSAYNAPIWITEAGARIDDPNPQEPDGAKPQCNNGELDAYNYTWSAFKVGNCLDWMPDPHLARLRQAWAAQAFLDLPLSGRVTQVDWWTPEDPPGAGWDSALLDTGGLPRSSYCVLAYAEPPAAAAIDPRCPGSPLDRGDIDEQ
jgi:hypothetical protein